MAEPSQKSPLSEPAMLPNVERCRTEITEIEAQLRSGHRDTQGLILALMDWLAELRLVERETVKHHKEAG